MLVRMGELVIENLGELLQMQIPEQLLDLVRHDPDSSSGRTK